MVFFICFLYVSLLRTVSSSGDLLNDMISSPTPGAECSPMVTFPNGKSTGLAIASFLNNSRIPCHSTISNSLKEIFRDGPNGEAIRGEMRTTLGDLCSEFVTMVSIIAYNDDYIGRMCDASDALEESMMTESFCRTHSLQSESDDALIEDLRMLNFTAISRQLNRLLNLDTECAGKCDGSQNGRVLCNAYYFMATLLSEVMDVKPSPSPISKPPLSALDHSFISALLDLSRETLTGIMIASPRNLKLTNFPPSLLSQAETIPDISTVLRMIWVAKIAPPSLGKLSEEMLRLCKEHDNKNLFTLVRFTDKDKAIIQDFEDLGTILDYIREYKSMLFPSDYNTLPGIAPGTGGNNIPGRSTPPSSIRYNNPKGNSLPDSAIPGRYPLPGTEDSTSRNTLPGMGAGNGGDSAIPGRYPLPDQKSPPSVVPTSSIPDRNTLPSVTGDTNAPPSVTPNTDAPPSVTPNTDAPPSVTPNTDAPPSVTPNTDAPPSVTPNTDAIGPTTGKKQKGDVNGDKSDDESDYGEHMDEDDFMGGGGPINYGRIDGGDPSNGDGPSKGNGILIGTTSIGGAVPRVNVGGMDVDGKDVGGKDVDGKDVGDGPAPSTVVSYGPLHFLVIFFVIGSVAVTAYICLHNRKKVREGVGAYLTDASKRRRTRNYRPLATSSA